MSSIEFDENVLKNGKDAIKQNMFEALDEFVSTYADEMEQMVKEFTKLQAENAELREKLDKTQKREVVLEIALQLRDIFINKYSSYATDCTRHTGERDSNINVPLSDVLKIINAVAKKYGVEVEE